LRLYSATDKEKQPKKKQRFAQIYHHQLSWLKRFYSALCNACLLRHFDGTKVNHFLSKIENIYAFFCVNPQKNKVIYSTEAHCV
jgi:hypothetical protein